MNLHIDRRGFLRIAGTVCLSATLPFPARVLARPGNAALFPQGVASCDPAPDSVLLWTRAAPSPYPAAGASPTAPPPTSIPLVVQVSRSASFEQVLVEAEVTAEQKDDYTVRALIEGLEPATHYYYRFVAADGGSASHNEGGASRVGRTLTAPMEGAMTPLQLAFASCQNYEQGHFGAWGRMLRDDRARPAQQQIHFVLHLGDFIYERYRHRPRAGETLPRRLPPFPDGARDGTYHWADSLNDYRHLYKTYLADPHLQAARARWPFVCTWDDHEFSNDSFQHFSTYGAPPKPELQRRRNAHQAWFEYIPARIDAAPDLSIHRRLRWGRQVDLLITDLRSHRSGPALPDGMAAELGLPLDAVELVDIFDGGRAHNNGKPPATLPFGDGATPNSARNRAPRTMLGAAQKDWFKRALEQSTANWKVWGNSLPLLPLRLDLSSLPFYNLPDSLLSQDAWAGFPGEYRELMAWLQARGVTGMVSLSGDHHCQGAGTLALNPDAPNTPAVAADFNVTGISSTPHFDSVLRTAKRDNEDFLQLVAAQHDGEQVETWNMSLLHGVLASLAYTRLGWRRVARWLGPNKANPGLAYADTNSNGYGLARFDSDHCAVELVTTTPAWQTADAGDSAVVRRAHFHLPLWGAGETPQLDGPRFEGQPPFPFAG